MFCVIIYNFVSGTARIPYFKPNVDKLVPGRVVNVCQVKLAWTAIESMQRVVLLRLFGFLNPFIP